jgi:two-component system, OmpR family, sensor histidine kinase TctE
LKFTRCAALATSSSKSTSLRRQLLRRLLPPLCLLFLLSGINAYYQAFKTANEAYDHWLADSVNSLAQLLTWHEGRAAFVFPNGVQRMFEWDDTDKTYFHVIGSQSGTLAGDPIERPASVVVNQLGKVQLFDTSFKTEIIRVAVLNVNAPQEGETVEIIVAETQHKRNFLIRKMLRDSLLPLIVLILVAISVVWFELRRALTPIHNVARSLESQTHHSFDRIDDTALPSEVHPLTHALNDLLDRLRTALATQRRFIADAAHQLRTPLTGLKLNVDDALRETTLVGVTPILQQAQISADQLVRLTNQLLFLARAEPDATRIRFEPVDLVTLVFETGAQWVSRSLEIGIDLGFEASEGLSLIIQSDVVMLKEAVANLLDNALRYAGTGACVTLKVCRADPNTAMISVEDNGPGIPPHERQAVLQRFYRGEGMQSHQLTGTPGSGLGLSIVKEVVLTHGGHIQIDTARGGTGVNISIFLPLLLHHLP